MVENMLTERQRYWLDHILATEAFDGMLVEYVRVEGLRAKDLHQWKTLLASRGAIVGETAQTNKRGPTPKLQSQIEQVRQLPRAKQRLVSDMIETALQQCG